MQCWAIASDTGHLREDLWPMSPEPKSQVSKLEMSPISRIWAVLASVWMLPAMPQLGLF